VTEREPDRESDEASEEVPPQVAHVESKIPWLIVGSIVIFVLWFPTSLDLGSRPASPREIPWIPGLAAADDPAGNPADANPSESIARKDAVDAGARGNATDATTMDASADVATGAASHDDVSLPRMVNGLAMRWLATTLDPVMRFGESAESDHGLAAARRVSNLAGLFFLLVFFALGRRVVGNAPALVAACLLAVTGPFIEASRSAHPLLLAEALALAGVGWMIGIEARHREVGYTIASALEI
jgi:hypothetical protein